MSERIVVALGGNALGKNLPEQAKAVQITSRAIVDLIERGDEVIVVHGNGPQVGMIANAMTELTRSDPETYIPCPLSVCGAMSQGYIGYDLQNALREEMERRGIARGVATVLTQVEVDPADPAFESPTKPIGSYMTAEEADVLRRERDYDFMHDERLGYRRVVASPLPKRIVELDTISTLVEAEHVVIACGGGGVPVEPAGNHHLKGAAAVIDKDYAAELLAESLDADRLVILTAVERVAVRFGTPEERWLDELTPAEARELADAGEFGKGSMEPKVLACAKFVESKPGRSALITLLERARDGLEGKTGTAVRA